MKIKRLTRGLVLKTGLEPVRPNGHWILSPLTHAPNKPKLTHYQLVNVFLILFNID
ncbi:hypothetical protein HSX10_05115 [Winogradskyella undariae]|uniref:hypothetical protein n=1 Tax=Winogradskyella undariae TaxID=1285465 RepID=UPI00156AEA44|nr:hypothetical protein [Winogradskyella undariae]NRR90938.1 hypothetical protein [Winogradskyella undariae]